MNSKGARPTGRDIKLLRLLFDYGLASSSQISSWLFKGIEKTTVLRRLRRLEDGGFIRKRGTLPDGTAVFLIGQEGAKLLDERLAFTTYPAHQLLHEIEIGAVRWTLDQLGVVKSWMTEKRMRSEIARQNPRKERSNFIIPDALILFRHFLVPNAKVDFEMELHLKSDQRYKAKFHKFDPERQKSRSFHWYLVRTNSCGHKIKQLARKYGSSNAEEYIGYTLLPDLLEKPIEAKLYTAGNAIPLSEVLSI